MTVINKRFYKERKKKVIVKFLDSENQSFLYNKKFTKKKLTFLIKIYNKNFKKKVSSAVLQKGNVIKRINIKVVQNNIFCTFTCANKKKTLHVGSSGIYKIKLSKRKMKYAFNAVALVFFSKIKKHCKNFNNTLFNISAPVKIRKKLCKIIKTQIRRFRQRKKNILLNITAKKCFNGCRVKKKLRKKRRLYRIYKK